MKKITLGKYLVAYVGLAGFAVAVEATTTEVTPSTPGVWNYETAGYGATPGSYVANPPSAIPIVSSQAPAGANGSVQLLTDAGGPNAAAQISTAAYDGQLLSSIVALSYSEKTVANNGSANPYISVTVSLNSGGVAGAGGIDTLFFEPPYQTPSSGNPALPNQGPSTLNTWQTWNAIIGGWWDNNGVFNPGTGVGSLAAFEAANPYATISDNPFTAGDGGISITAGWNGSVNEGYVNDVTINSTTYDFEPDGVSAVPEPTTIISGVALLLPFAAGACGKLRRTKNV
jgi:hypothetical protein